MRSTSQVVVALAFSFITAGCGAAAGPKVDLAAEEATIRQMTKDWFAAEVRRDMNASLAGLAPDAVLQFEGMPPASGIAAWRSYYEAQFKMPLSDVRMGPRTVVVASSGDLAYDVGAFTGVMTGGAELHAKSTIVWRKIDGKWKVVLCAASTDAPAATPSSGSGR
jgi:uncharacterized protein (TIGR02246 family)